MQRWLIQTATDTATTLACLIFAGILAAAILPIFLP